jgi:hypothetical protein
MTPFRVSMHLIFVLRTNSHATVRSLQRGVSYDIRANKSTTVLSSSWRVLTSLQKMFHSSPHLYIVAKTAKEQRRQQLDSCGVRRLRLQHTHTQQMGTFKLFVAVSGVNRFMRWRAIRKVRTLSVVETMMTQVVLPVRAIPFSRFA